MRLNSEQQNIISATLYNHFGKDSKVMLFGSRVNDELKGGDIDIYIEPEIQQPDVVIEAKFKALIELRALLGDQKIDLVIHRKKTPLQPIHIIAQQTGVTL